MNGLTIALWILAIIGIALIVIDAMYLINNWNIIHTISFTKKTPIDQVLLKLAHSDSSDYDANMKAIMKVAGSWLRVFRVLKDSDYKYTQVIDSDNNAIVYDLSNFKDNTITPAMSFVKNNDNSISLHHTEEPVYNEETGEYTTKINLHGLDVITDPNTPKVTTYNQLPTASPNRKITEDDNTPNIFIEFFKPVEYSHIKN